MITLPGILHHSSKSVAIEPPPKPPLDVFKSAITFLGIRRRRISVLNNAPIEICREIIKMNFCRLKPANKEITDDEFLELISKVHSLTSVNLSGCCNLTPTSLQVLAERFPSLLHFKCYGNINDIDKWKLGSLSILGNFKELRGLSLDTRIHDPLEDRMEEMKTLIERLPKLEKYSGRVNREVLYAMANHCRNLTDLKIYEHNEEDDLITDYAFEALALRCPNIRSISLDNCIKITVKTLSVLASNCQNLESVKIHACDNIGGREIIKFTEQCKQLKSLTLEELSEINDENLHFIARNCSNLESISVYGSPHSISDRGVIHLIEHCKKLKSINLWGDISDETVFAINQNLDDIRSLSLSFCEISDDSIIPFAEKHTRVTHLYLSSTHITDKSLFSLAKYCHHLVKIDLQKTNITEKGIVALIENSPHLRTCFIEVDGKFQSPLRTKYPHIKFDNL